MHRSCLVLPELVARRSHQHLPATVALTVNNEHLDTKENIRIESTGFFQRSAPQYQVTKPCKAAGWIVGTESRVHVLHNVMT